MGEMVEHEFQFNPYLPLPVDVLGSNLTIALRAMADGLHVLVDHEVDADDDDGEWTIAYVPVFVALSELRPIPEDEAPDPGGNVVLLRPHSD